MDFKSDDLATTLAAGASAQLSATWWRMPRVQGYALYLTLLALLFLKPLVRLAVYAYGSDLDSHVVWVAFIVAYLLYTNRPAQPRTLGTGLAGGLVLGLVAVASLGLSFWLPDLSVNDQVTLTTFSFVSFVAAGGFFFLGTAWMASQAFAMAFLIFMVPMPDVMRAWLERMLMLLSADAASMFLNMTDVPFIRDGAEAFELPGIHLVVARECSGIHSTWVLFITSLLAAHKSLHSPWRRLLLVAFVFPLGVIRNGFRIMVIGLLCVKIGPQMVDHPIHRQGGPIFFALSLVPLFLFLLALQRGERKRSPLHPIRA
jgi:exosortase C (VPDSG-CTERM-specific)